MCKAWARENGMGRKGYAGIVIGIVYGYGWNGMEWVGRGGGSERKVAEWSRGNWMLCVV